MQRERDGRGNGFNPSHAFSGFEGIGGFGSHRSMAPSLFGGRDPFDDPFFTRPLGSMFSSRTASSDRQHTNGANGIKVEELNSDDEGGTNNKENGDEKDFHNKFFGSSIEPSIEHPDDDDDDVDDNDDDVEKKSKIATFINDHNKVDHAQPRSFTYQKVTYGGVDGTYYTSTRSRRTGTDGVSLDESKEADGTTGQATHRISRGIHNKGHSVTRKLNADGKVDTMQMLHNLNEDEFASFEEAWRGNVIGKFPGWKDRYDTHGMEGSSRNEQKEMQIREGWAFPSLQQDQRDRGFGPDNYSSTSSSGRTRKTVRINIE
ncbi:myeloid leukemia factor 1 [Quillaja saponaria]|uniref:Myeloid leukemia factor 1 n=1 Tax=Quillaja saponaria TaxID=32244 RepID=A0AAD7PND0_QUISA|nr:myeloid leukemia factor 1 [Quillaja saponaria]